MVAVQVELAWHCATSNFSGTYKLHRVAEGRPLWEADISTGLECASVGNSSETILTIQVLPLTHTESVSELLNSVGSLQIG